MISFRHQRSLINSVSLIEIIYLAGTTMANRYFLPLCPQNVTCLKTEIQGIYLLKLRDTKEQFVTTSISSEEFWFLLNRVL